MRIILASMLCLLPLCYCAAAPPRGLEDLGADLLGDDLLKQLVPADEPKQELPDLDDVRRSLKHPDGEDIGQRSSDNPLAVVEQKMRTAQTLIDRQDVTGKTKQVQGEVVDELDKLIAKLEEECKNCKGGQCNKPSSSQQQTAKSTPKPGSKPSTGDQQSKPSDSPANQQPSQSQQAQSPSQTQSPPQGGEASTSTDAVDPQQMLKEVWGQLPERMRQQMLQSSASEFLPQYRDDIEAYFKQLAAPQN